MPSGWMLLGVDGPSVAETLPESYRRVLDRVADLDVAGYRHEADLIRRDAIAAYSRRWNTRASVRLGHLGDRAERVLDGRDRPRLARRSRRGPAAWVAFAPGRIARRITIVARRRIAGGRGMTLERPTV